MNASETERTAVADEVPGLEVHHLMPSMFINMLSEALREHYGIASRHQTMLDELRANESAYAELGAAVERGYQELAKALTQVRLKQHDIADVLGVSQSHVNRLIKLSATGTGSAKVAGVASGAGTTSRRRG